MRKDDFKLLREWIRAEIKAAIAETRNIDASYNIEDITKVTANELFKRVEPLFVENLRALNRTIYDQLYQSRLRQIQGMRALSPEESPFGFGYERGI